MLNQGTLGENVTGRKDKYRVNEILQNVSFLEYDFPLSWVIDLLIDVTIKVLFIAENYICGLKKQ